MDGLRMFGDLRYPCYRHVDVIAVAKEHGVNMC